MIGLPTSLSIALWLTGSLWVVGGFAYAVDAPSELVWATFLLGLLAGLVEWSGLRRSKR
ncbi:MAG: hypothetical protein WDO24_11550 [Pseudomonadota bacterium]